MIQSRPLRRLLTFLLIMVGVIIPMCSAHVCPAFMDMFYQSLCVRAYSQSPMAMLTFYVGNVWTSTAGDSIYSLNMLRNIVNFICFGFASLWMWRITRNGLWSAAMFFLMCAMSEFTQMPIYNWDTGAYLWIMLTALSTIMFIRSTSSLSLVLIGVFGALMTLSRIPTAPGMLIPLIVAIYRYQGITGKYWNAPFLKAFMLCFGVYCLTLLSVILIMCGSVAQYAEAFNPDNLISGHADFAAYYYRFGIFIPTVSEWGSVLLLFVGAVCVTHVQMPRWCKVAAIVVTYIIAWDIIRCARMSEITIKDFGLAQGLLLLVAALVIIKVGSIRKRSASDYVAVKDYVWVVCTIMAFALLPLIGTDTPAERMVALPFIPIMISCLYVVNSGFPKTLKYVVIELIVMSAYTNLYTLYTYVRDDAHIVEDIPHLGPCVFGNEEVEWEENLRATKHITDSLQDKGLTVAYWSCYSKEFSYQNAYFFTDTVPESLQVFHPDLSNAEHRRVVFEYLTSHDRVLSAMTGDEEDVPSQVSAEWIKALREEYGYRSAPAPGDLQIYSR